MRSIKFLTILCAGLALQACSKEEHSHGENHATITFNSPQANQQFAQNDTVQIAGTIVAEAYLHGYDIYVRPKNDTTTLFHFDSYDHDSILNFSTAWVNTRISGNLEVSLTVALDHDGNTATRTVDIMAMP